MYDKTLNNRKSTHIASQRVNDSAKLFIIRGCADKSLARPTFRCRRTESIVLLERGVCSCAELQVFFLQRLKGGVSGDARDFNNVET